MADRKTRIAIIYDFDRTLSKSEMQDGFIKTLEMEPDEFWNRSGKLAKEQSMDSKLAYLYLMIKDSNERGMPLSREKLREFGKNIEFYDGVLEWFSEIGKVAEQYDIEIEHYIISAGLKEIIEGTPIYKYFERVYACEYLYDEKGTPTWVKNVVNFTSKTQFVFRINKGEFDISDEVGVNKFVPHDERPFPFSNMIYIGDGTTDIPCMKLVREYGGHSIGVYSGDRSKVEEMMYDDRISFICEADYRKGSRLFDTVSRIIGMLSFGDGLRVQGYNDFKSAEKHAIEAKNKDK